MKQPVRKLVLAAAVLTVFVVLSTLSSCFSLIESAVEDAIAKETEEAVTDAAAKESQSQSESSESSPAAELASEHNIAGAWINAEYNDEGRSARVVYSLTSEGNYTYLAFDTADGGGEVYEGTVQYLKTWIDAQGRSCGQSIVTLSNGMSWKTLDRISVDGSALEVQSGVRKINPKGPRYSIYYRP